MFVRKKKNRSGTTSVVVVDKHGGKFKELHTVGIGYDESEIERLCLQGQKWIKSHLGIMEIDFDEADPKELERKNAEAVLDNIDGSLQSPSCSSAHITLLLQDAVRHHPRPG